VAANESPSLDDALQAAVDHICSHLGWPVGHAYLAVGSTAVVVLSDIWYLDDLRRFEAFKHAVEATLVAPSSGITGRTLAQRAPRRRCAARRNSSGCCSKAIQIRCGSPTPTRTS